MPLKKMDLFMGVCWTIVFVLDLAWYYRGDTPPRMATLTPAILLAAKYFDSGLSINIL